MSAMSVSTSCVAWMLQRAASLIFWTTTMGQSSTLTAFRAPQHEIMLYNEVHTLDRHVPVFSYFVRNISKGSFLRVW